eukprot:s1172_g3.t1
MYQRKTSKIVHLEADAETRQFQCGIVASEEHEHIQKTAFLDARKCKRCQRAVGTSPSDDVVRDFYGTRVPVNMAAITSTKLLVFEAHTLVVANIKSEISKKDEPTHHVLPPAERDRRIQEQQVRLKGVRFKGDEENAHSNYDLAFSMLERDTLLYIHPEKFVTRRHQYKEPGKEIVLDHSALTVRATSPAPLAQS